MPPPPPRSTLFPYTTLFRSTNTPCPTPSASMLAPSPARSAPPTSSPSKSWRASAKRSEEHTSELQSPDHLVCRLLLEKKKAKSFQIQALASIYARLTDRS